MINFKQLTTRELITLVAMAVCLLVSVALIINSIIVSANHQKTKDELILLQIKLDERKSDYEKVKYSLENEIFNLVKDKLKWKAQRKQIEQQLLTQKEEEEKIQQQLNKLKNEIKQIKRPNVNYSDSTIVSIDSLLPK